MKNNESCQFWLRVHLIHDERRIVNRCIEKGQKKLNFLCKNGSLSVQTITSTWPQELKLLTEVKLTQEAGLAGVRVSFAVSSSYLYWIYIIDGQTLYVHPRSVLYSGKPLIPTRWKEFLFLSVSTQKVVSYWQRYIPECLIQELEQCKSMKNKRRMGDWGGRMISFNNDEMREVLQ